MWHCNGAQLAIESAKSYSDYFISIVSENIAASSDEERHAAIAQCFKGLRPPGDGSHISQARQIAPQMFQFPWEGTS